MGKLIASEWMSLDGVMQSPAYPDEDASGGFKHGGWHSRYFDDVSMRWVVENVTSAGGYVLGRRTYEIFAAHWPNAPEEQQILAEPLNSRQKYVASRSLKEPLAWQNSMVLDDDLTTALTELKQEHAKDLLVIGSAELVGTLLARDLLDELRLMIDPIILGCGKRLFKDDGALRPMRLVTSQTTATGAILVTYARAAG